MNDANLAITSGTNNGFRLEIEDLRSHGPRSLTESLARRLRYSIRDGRLPAGTPLPSSRGLASDLGVSRGVVVRAYEQLVAEGYLHSHTGRRTTVAAIHASEGRTPPSTDRAILANPGLPALNRFPRREWQRSMSRALTEMPDASLGYGDPRGHPRLRRALASYLGRTRSVVAPVDQIVVTSGYAQGLRLVAEALVARGLDTIGVEDPGSPGVADSLSAGGLSTVAVEVDDHGIRTSDLEKLDAVAVTPAHQFPTGAVMSAERRTELMEWAVNRRAVIAEDDYDAEFRYDRAPVGAIQGLLPDRIVYGGSVSKILAPALRVGWLVAPSWLAGTLAEMKHLADIASPALAQVTLAAFIESGGLDRHVRRMNTVYTRNRRRLLGAVDRHLPGWKVTGAAAGLHAVLAPPGSVSREALEAVAASAIDLVVVPLFVYARANPSRPALVVGYGAATPDQVERGVAGMAAALKSRRD